MSGSRDRQQVPYNKLLLRLSCHCNVELCMSIKSIKYVFKYMHKGCDQAMFALRSSQVNEISDYQNARYVSSNEAAWRILDFQYTREILLFSNLLSIWRKASEYTLLNIMHWIVLQGIHPRLHLQSFLHCVVWIAL